MSEDGESVETAAGNPNDKKVKTRHEVVFVDDDLEEIEKSVGFSPGLFIKNEFKVLKKFCNSRKVHQRHLNFLFNKYLSSEDVYLRQFRVRTLDMKEQFDTKEKLMREISEIFFPSIYMKDFVGLEPAFSLNEVTFARWFILTYIFCAEPIPDLILNLFAILRQRFNLQVTATMFAFNVEQIVSLFGELVQPSATRTFFLKLLRALPKDKEFSIGEVIQMGIKYPLMFYALKQFRVHVRRIFGGDKFWNEPIWDKKGKKIVSWKERKNLKSKVAATLHIEKGYEVHFESQEAAHKETARVLLADIMDAKVGAMALNPHKTSTTIKAVDDTIATHVKRSIGFHVAKKIIVEADLEYPKETQGFLDDSNIEYGLQDSRFHDTLSDQHLTYNNSTGRRSWVLKYMHYEDGRQEEVLKEVEIDHEPAFRDDLEEEEEDDDDDDDYY
jgi:hypothetical protein